MKTILALAGLSLALVGCHVHEEECHYDAHGVYHCHDSHDNITYFPESGGEYGWEETWCYDGYEWYMQSYQLVADYF